MRVILKISVGPKPNDRCPYKKNLGPRDTGYVKMGVMFGEGSSFEPKKGEDCWPLEARRGKTILSSAFQEGWGWGGPANTLTPD